MKSSSKLRSLWKIALTFTFVCVFQARASQSFMFIDILLIYYYNFTIITELLKLSEYCLNCRHCVFMSFLWYTESSERTKELQQIYYFNDPLQKRKLSEKFDGNWNLWLAGELHWEIFKDSDAFSKFFKEHISFEKHFTKYFRDLASTQS